jgi:Predicted membrane protein (DUF2306)
MRGNSQQLQRLMWIGLLTLCVIAGAAVIHRLLALAHPAKQGSVQLAMLDQAFAGKPALTLVHIIPGLALVLLIPWQFSLTFRARYLQAHRWIGRISMGLGLVISASAFVLLGKPVGGFAEVTAILVFNTIFLVSLVKAYLNIRQRRVAQHREWIIRAMSVAVGVATVRPIMGAFFATSRWSGMTPEQFFGIAFWIGFTLTFVVGEAWIRYTRPHAAGSRAVAKTEAA